MQQSKDTSFREVRIANRVANRSFRATRDQTPARRRARREKQARKWASS